MDEHEAAVRMKHLLARRDGIVPDMARGEGLLRDYFPAERGDAEALLAALREGIPDRLRSDRNIPGPTLRANLEGLLHRHRRTDTEAAAWAVAVWAAALDIDLGLAPSEPDREKQRPSWKLLLAAAALPVGVIVLPLIVLIAMALSKLPYFNPPANWADWSKTPLHRIEYALDNVWNVEAFDFGSGQSGLACIASSYSHYSEPGIVIGITHKGDKGETYMNFIFGDDVDLAKSTTDKTKIKVMIDIDNGTYRAEFSGDGHSDEVAGDVIASTNPVFEAMREGSVMVVTALVPGRPQFVVPLATSFSLFHPITWKSLISHSRVSAAYQAWQEVGRCATENGIKF